MAVFFYSMHKNTPIAAFWALTNGLFLYKYGQRFMPELWAIFIAIIITILGIGAFSWLKKHSFHTKTQTNILSVSILLLFLSAFIANKETLQVDRWSVISSFWETAFMGSQPYEARSHMQNPPGPFPIYFLINLPFYALGILHLVTCIFFIAFVLTFKGSLIQNPLAILILIGSISIYYESITYSNLFANGALSCIAFRWTNDNKKSIKNGFILGLVLATRGITAIPLAVWFGQRVKQLKALSIIKLIIGGILALLLAFVPIATIDFCSFLDNNPIILQADFFLPSWLSILCVSTIFCFSIIQKEIAPFTTITYGLIITLLMYYLYGIGIYGWKAAILQSGCDLTYCAFVIPFASLALTEE